MEEIPCAAPDSPDGVMPVLLEELAPLQLSVVFWREWETGRLEDFWPPFPPHGHFALL